MVTWCSCMTSSSADWTLAEERLISSASEQVGKDRAELGHEAAVGAGVHARANQVGRDQVGRELDAAEAAAHDLGQGFDGGRLGQARHAFEQDVAAREQRHEQAFEQAILSDDQSPQLEEHLFQLTSGGWRRRNVSGVGRDGRAWGVI